MVRKTFELIIDTKRPMSNREFEIVTGDNGNILDCRIYDNGEPVDLSGCWVIAVFSNTNGVSVQNSNAEGGGVTVDITGDEKNRVVIDLLAGSYSVGTTECELQIYNETESGEIPVMVTTARFNFSARAAFSSKEAVESTKEYPLLLDLYKRTDETVAACDAAAQKANEAAAYAKGFEFSVGTVQTVPSSEPVSVVNRGIGNKIILDFKIPRGEAGAETYCLSAVMTSYGSGNLELSLFRNGELCTDTVHVLLKKKAVGSNVWTEDSLTMNAGTATYAYTNTISIVATAFSDPGRSRVLASSAVTCGAVGSISNIHSGTTEPVPGPQYAVGDIYFQYGVD